MGVRGNGTGPKAKRQYMVADEEDRFSDQAHFPPFLEIGLACGCSGLVRFLHLFKV